MIGRVDAAAPVGVNWQPIQVLSPDENTVTSVAIGASNARTTIPAGADVVEVSVADSCRFAFGDSGVDATIGTRRILHRGVYAYRVPPGATHYAVVQVGAATGTVTVARLR